MGNLGDEASISLNIVVSRDWRLGERYRYINGINLIKAELSNYNLRLGGDWTFIAKAKKLGLEFEMNSYNQDVNKNDNNTSDITNANIATTSTSPLNVKEEFSVYLFSSEPITNRLKQTK